MLGLISGTFSTLLITLGAPRIGRARAVDWMTIGTVALGANAVTDDPGWRQLIAGVLVHQVADLAWAIVLFALGRYWTFTLSPLAIAFIAAPWALATSAAEYYVFLPRLQPLVPLEVPYWTALGVHVTSAVAYPLFPWIRNWVNGTPISHETAAARWTSGAMVTLLVALTSAELLAQAGREPEWPFEDAERAALDRQFLASMTRHHEAGVELARAALAGPLSEEAATVARLIAAEQSREISLLRLWWRSWAAGNMPNGSENLKEMGVPAPNVIAELSQSTAPDRERQFLLLMIEHHTGAVAMADEAFSNAEDPRIRLFSTSVSHAQSGQIAWMRALLGEPPVRYRAPRFRSKVGDRPASALARHSVQ